MKLLLVCLLISVSFGAMGQRIVSKKDNDKAPYLYEGRQLNFLGLGKVVQEHPEAYAAFKKGRSVYYLSTGIGVVGGYIMGWQLGNAINESRDFNTLVFLGGAAIAGVSFIVDGGANRHFRQSVELFNQGRPSLGRMSSVLPRIGVTAHGVGLQLIFGGR